ARECFETITTPITRALGFVGHHLKESLQTAGRSIYRASTWAGRHALENLTLLGRSISRKASGLGHHIREISEDVELSTSRYIEGLNPIHAFWRAQEEEALFNDNPKDFTSIPVATGNPGRYRQGFFAEQRKFREESGSPCYGAILA
uniref:hypothetical protein n=1 Tax=Legionella gresilensis TaxID=91823 RepID=UPI0013EF9986